MAPKNARIPEDEDTIVVHDTDSESDSDHPSRQRSKRQKLTAKGKAKEETIDMDVEMPDVWTSGSKSAPTKPASKNSQLKGRKRFLADLADIKAECKSAAIEAHKLKVTQCRPGDEEGSIECIIVNIAGEAVLAINMLVSDTSDYPSQHTMFAFSPQSNVSPTMLQVVESVSTGSSRSIRDTVLDVLKTLRRALDTGKHRDPSPDIQFVREVEMVDDDDDESGEDYDPDEYDDFEQTASLNNDIQLGKLQHDFLDTIATEYRPGIIRFGGDDFALSVSTSVIALADSIPPRALMAWDRRLLSKTQHLTLLISGFQAIYPPLHPDGKSVRVRGTAPKLRFRVGLTQRYKPGKDHAREAGRTFGLITPDAEDVLRAQAEQQRAAQAAYDLEMEGEDEAAAAEETEEEADGDPGRFDKFSLSSSLESLLDHALLTVIQFRRQFKLGWAGAEALHSEVEKSQMKPEDVLKRSKKAIIAADKAERQLGKTYQLPHDPLAELEADQDINLPLTAFCYLVRRLTLCTRYCLVCHNPINTDFEALKPYVCDSHLCAYQYYNLNRGPSLEYEIRTNPSMVDLLVSLAYSSAAEGALSAPFPLGMALRVPIPAPTSLVAPPPIHPQLAHLQTAPVAPPAPPLNTPDADGLVEFDRLNEQQMRACIATLIDSLPSIADMKKHLDKKVMIGKVKPVLKDMDPKVPAAAWAILRWCVASCTAHLEEVRSADERIQQLGATWRQFRFSVGAPDAEAKFNKAVTRGQAEDQNMKKFPSLYAFHGSAVKNWHSIIRHGLWFKEVINGRAFGNGVYLAKDAATSMSHYAASSRTCWKNSRICPSQCVALAQVINQPTKFVSKDPHYVVKDLDWIVCRYLLIRGTDEINSTSDSGEDVGKIPMVPLDPKTPVTITTSGTPHHIKIPKPEYRISTLLSARKGEFVDEDHDDEDQAVFTYAPPPPGQSQQKQWKEDDDDDDVYDVEDSPPPPPVQVKAALAKAQADDWKHDEEWVQASIAQLMPPPIESTPGAAMAVQRELRAMVKEQEKAEKAGKLKELGWYLSQELMGDNLFQWIVEMHSFDETLPIARDLKDKKLNSIVFEIRFPPDYPMSPPFFRIIGPRFLPFIHGGGGHITGGGSICMDLLTSSGWLAIYSIPAILMQIKLAISNLDPRPARLAQNWKTPYSVAEALAGYKRAAATHGWALPPGLDRLLS